MTPAGDGAPAEVTGECIFMVPGSSGLCVVLRRYQYDKSYQKYTNIRSRKCILDWLFAGFS